jgi:hypothetical protein
MRGREGVYAKRKSVGLIVGGMLNLLRERSAGCGTERRCILALWGSERLLLAQSEHQQIVVLASLQSSLAGDE